MQKLVIVSGYFNPIHMGHIEYFQKAREFGDALCVIVNNDFQRELKGSKPFMNENERVMIVRNIKGVDFVVLSLDEDRTVCETLTQTVNCFAGRYDLFFANGGDQDNDSIPEAETCKRLGIQLIDGLGDKVQSSSWLLKDAEGE